MRRTFAILALAALSAPTLAQPPQYTIVDLGVLPTHTTSQGFRVSPNGIATGRSVGSGLANAFSWTESGGLVGLPNLTSPARAFSVGNGVNNAGTVVGTGSTTPFGSSPLPLIWQGGTVAQLPLPAGETLGRANGINAAGTAVGSVNGGSAERAAIYTGGAAGSAAILTQTTPTGCFATTAFGINDGGRIVGIGIDPNNAARNVGYAFDTSTGTAFEVGALPGMNSAICFGVGNGGHIVGSSMLNQGSGLPFIWSDLARIQPIPLPAGASTASARAVNLGGWAVGTASSAFAIPFLYDGTATYRLGDLIPAGTGWDLLTNTSSSALGIADDGIIVGTAVFNGSVRAYAMIPIPAPGSLPLLAACGLAAARRRRRR
ncbi:MAG: MYXO-CTERM sorting domain-containing protein [Phycisphaerales bacterium]